jgi:hypothetical protein
MNTTNNKTAWWSSLTDECPITLEPLASLPYPPFVLSPSDGGGKKAGNGNINNTKPTNNNFYFDGLALATYVVSQGNFVNPLTRQALSYDDCVLLDEYLCEHVYQGANYFLKEKISVREAYALRDSIKVKLGGGGGRLQNENQQRRAEILRDEAAVALRGLFVFGHQSKGRGGDTSWSTASDWQTNSQALPRAQGGFDLHHVPDSANNHSWGASSADQAGLRIIDDDEAAFEAADIAAWQEVQEAFPHLSCIDTGDTEVPPSNRGAVNIDNKLLETVHQTADSTLREEQEKARRMQQFQERCFFEALQRKRNRMQAKLQAKSDAASLLANEQEAKIEIQSARDEIDRWREQQWKQWDRAASLHSSRQKAKDAIRVDKTVSNKPVEQPPTADELLAAEEAAAEKLAAKKRAKRQKAKEKAKEKKLLERLENEKMERALAIQKKKEESATKCGACDDGVLGCGFEKFGTKFCSTKCARSGPSPT